MISVIVLASGKTRQQEINFQAVLKALCNQAYRNFEVIIVEQLMEDDYLYGHDRLRHLGLNFKSTYKHVKLARQPENRFYNLAWNRNAGTLVAEGDQYLFVDCDIVFDENYLQAVSETRYPHFIAWNQLYYLSREESGDIHAAAKIPLQQSIDKPGCGCSTMGDAGKSICITDHCFKNVVGGFNESMCGWGGEDNEMACRASHLLGKFNIMPYKILHLWHPRGNGTDYDQHPSHNMWRVGNEHPHEVTLRILKAGVGRPEGPTPIDMSDLGWTR